MSKSAKIIVFIIALIAVSAIAFFFFTEKSDVANPNGLSPAVNDNLVGNDRDEHGCIGSAGYSWCEAKTKCLRTWEEPCSTENEQAIRQLLAEKYNKPLAEVNVKINKQTADYLAGSVSFVTEGLPQPGEGGAFLAVKHDGAWALVYDGNGSIDCDSIKANYQFPADMLVGFCD